MRDKLLHTGAAAVTKGGAPSGSWLTPHSSMRIALLYFGKVGTIRDPSSYLAKDSGDEASLRLSHATVRRHLIDANPRAPVDVFSHSWNPSLGNLISDLHGRLLKWSSHDEQEYDERVPSAALSLKRVLAAKTKHEQAGGFTYDLCAALRHDLILFSPLRLAELPAAQLWLPMQCCGADPEGATTADASRGLERAYAQTSQTCLTGSGTVSEFCRVRNMLRSVNPRASRLISDEANFNYWVNDWLLLAPSRTLDTFSAIYDRIEDYRDGLREVGITTEWMHFFWAAHIHHALRVTDGVRPLPLRAAVDFTIGRLASSERLCTTNVSVAHHLPTYTEPQWGRSNSAAGSGAAGLSMTERLCPARGEVACKWSSLRCSVDTPRVSWGPLSLSAGVRSG